MTDFEAQYLDHLSGDKEKRQAENETLCQKIVETKEFKEAMEAKSQNSILTFEQCAQQAKGEILELLNLEEYDKMLAKGFALIREGAPNMLPAEDSDALFEEIDTIADKITKGVFNTEPFETSAKFLNITPRFFVLVQKLGNLYYIKDDLEDAKSIYYLLISFHPYIPSFWLGLGHCESVAGEFQAAQDYYEIGGALGDALCYLYAAREAIKLNDKEKAQEFYQQGSNASSEEGQALQQALQSALNH